MTNHAFLAFFCNRVSPHVALAGLDVDQAPLSLLPLQELG